ncbi:unnamed protein product [Paramecium octaurelia]|uniref:Uncharacterized protein n=1 Tax=Paramecium octaurelia TaxID=43137 RepID=A0A8S1T8P7_PAROT|nr:unnamed protein product [Paramecium octaurelia]
MMKLFSSTHQNLLRILKYYLPFLLINKKLQKTRDNDHYTKEFKTLVSKKQVRNLSSQLIYQQLKYLSNQSVYFSSVSFVTVISCSQNQTASQNTQSPKIVIGVESVEKQLLTTRWPAAISNFPSSNSCGDELILYKANDSICSELVMQYNQLQIYNITQFSYKYNSCYTQYESKQNVGFKAAKKVTAELVLQTLGNQQIVQTKFKLIQSVQETYMKLLTILTDEDVYPKSTKDPQPCKIKTIFFYSKLHQSTEQENSMCIPQ